MEAIASASCSQQGSDCVLEAIASAPSPVLRNPSQQEPEGDCVLQMIASDPSAMDNPSQRDSEGDCVLLWGHRKKYEK